MEIFFVIYYFLPILLVCNAKEQTNTTPTPTTLPVRQLWNEIMLTVVSSLSVFGSVTIIVTYFLWRDLQTTARRILVYISIGDFFTVFPTLVIFWTSSYRKNDLNCRLQSFVTATAVMWSFFWTSSLAVYMYVALVIKRYEAGERLVVIFHIVNWTVPPVLLGIAWTQNHLGRTEGKSTADWCWIAITENHEDIIWMLLCGKLWEIFSYLINGVLYYSVTKNIKKEVSEQRHLLSNQSVQLAELGGRKLVLVPVVFIMLRIWGTIRFILLCFSAHVPRIIGEILITLQIIGDNSQGVANFILFCLLTEKFKRSICKVCRYVGKSSQHTSFIPNHRESHQHGGTFSNSATVTYHSVI